MSLDFKKFIEIEDLKFGSSNEIYFHIIDILENAVEYDEDKHDIKATIEEVEKYLLPLKEKVKLEVKL